ncbi:MAG: hypothetical protein WD607_05010, partial [Candidatus Paceibacterota bacterium]
MELDNLKSNWKKVGIGKKGQNELSMMTKIKNHPNITKIRIKFLIETILIIVFLAVYYDGFDGATKPLWANLLLIVATISYIIVRFVGWLVLRNPIKGDNLKTSLINFQNKLKRMAISVLVTSFLFGSAIILFFATSIDFTNGKYLMLAGMVLSLILLVYLSSRNWFKRVEGINTTLIDF